MRGRNALLQTPQQPRVYSFPQLLIDEMSTQGTDNPAHPSPYIPGLKDDERKKAAEIIQVLLQQPDASMGSEPFRRRIIEVIVLGGN